MFKIFKKCVHSDDGSSAIELAILLPVLLLMMLGAIDLGSAYARKMELANAAKSGVHYALVNKPIQRDLTQVIASVNTNLASSANGTTAVSASFTCKCDGVGFTCGNSCGAAGYVSTFVTVAVSETYVVPFFNVLWSDFFISERTTIQLD